MAGCASLRRPNMPGRGDVSNALRRRQRAGRPNTRRRRSNSPAPRGLVAQSIGILSVEAYRNPFAIPRTEFAVIDAGQTVCPAVESLALCQPQPRQLRPSPRKPRSATANRSLAAGSRRRDRCTSFASNHFLRPTVSRALWPEDRKAAECVAARARRKP